ncbi:hypothetical protein [Pseudonocardia spinosispora]|uniref:hypothetical protein n=1 Tax=Pseudonocardia spinosispora TaxID=103441 RepID=UPI00041B46B6|nr:hypothetical protein [Pseudonocardia spinosispora]
MAKGRFLLLFGAIFGLVGLTFLCIGIGLASSWRILSCTERSQGQVVALDEQRDPGISSSTRATVGKPVDGPRSSGIDRL